MIFAIKQFIMINCSFYLFVKLNYKNKIIFTIKTEIYFVVMSIIYSFLREFYNQFEVTLLIFIVFLITIILHYKTEIKNKIITATISYIIVYLVYFISALIYSIIVFTFFNRESLEFTDYILTELIMCFLVYYSSNLKKYSKGITVITYKIKLKNYAFVFFLLLANVILISFIRLGYHDTQQFVINLTFYIIVINVSLALFLFFFIKREVANNFTLSAQERSIENLSMENEFLTKELSKLNQLSSISHKTNHEIDVLKSKLKDMDAGDILDELNKLSDTYHESVKTVTSKGLLQNTNVKEIDDVLNYMQSVCNKSNIDFAIRVNGSVNYMVENYISVDKLKTLLSDHIKNAVIAISHSDNKFKSILVVIGEVEDFYGVTIFDSGIEFNISTLVNLGLKATTSHKSEGGTGFGVMTTFETLKETKASFIIEEKEYKECSYIKSITILFDDLNNYCINSYRNKAIKSKNKKNNIKFLDK